MNPETEAPQTASVPTVIPKTPRKKKSYSGPYKDEFADQAYKLCLLGAIDRDLGAFFGVTRETIIHWKSDHPAFAEAVSRGNRAADMENRFTGQRLIGLSPPGRP
ncbi:MAG: hypothetical protein V4581_15745 [Bacteroidota bacterium]